MGGAVAEALQHRGPVSPWGRGSCPAWDTWLLSTPESGYGWTLVLSLGVWSPSYPYPAPQIHLWPSLNQVGEDP